MGYFFIKKSSYFLTFSAITLFYSTLKSLKIYLKKNVYKIVKLISMSVCSLKRFLSDPHEGFLINAPRVGKLYYYILQELSRL